MNIGIYQNISEETDPTNYEIYNALKRRSDVNNIVLLRPKEMRIVVLNGNIIFYFNELKFTKDVVDIVIIRSVTGNVPIIIEFIKFCRNMGIKVFDNNLVELGFMINKKADLIKLASRGIPVPNTWVFSCIDELGKYDLKYPVVMKTTNTGKGKNVELIHSYEQARQVLYEKDKDISNFLFQEFIDYKYDVRLLVLGSNVVGAMRRIPKDGSFVANFSKGGQVEKFYPTNEMIKLAVKAKDACGLEMAGVDILVDKDDRYYVLEANKFPGIEGLTIAEGDVIADKILDYMIKNVH